MVLQTQQEWNSSQSLWLVAFHEIKVALYEITCTDKIKRVKMNSSYGTEQITHSSMFTGFKQNDANPTTDGNVNDIHLC